MLTATGMAARQERWLEAAGRVLRTGAVLWMAWVLAGLLWLLGGHDGASLPALPASPQGARPAAPPVDPARLASLNLFGLASVVAPPSDAAVNAPDTSLQLRLAGVFVSADAERSSAIVAERNGANGKLYRLNESLPGGAVLEGVFEDRILLRRGVSTEVLRFEKTGLLSGNAPPPSASGGVAGPAINARALIGSAMESLTSSPDAFLQEMGLRRGGAGYEVTSDTPEQMRRAAGLQPGDRLLSVNGRRLGDPQNDRMTLQEVQNSGLARVEVQRGGQIVTIERKF